MLEAQYQMLTLHWHALRGAITALRNNEEGMTTLEVLVIAAGLVVLAAGAITAFGLTAGRETAKLP
jgi:hypothetical protein